MGFNSAFKGLNPYFDLLQIIQYYSPLTKYHICIDTQVEHNYVILSVIVQGISYMFRPLFAHHQVLLRLQTNCIT